MSLGRDARALWGECQGSESKPYQTAVDPTDRQAAYAHVQHFQEAGEVVTGLLFVEQRGEDVHTLQETVETPLVRLPYDMRRCARARRRWRS